MAADCGKHCESKELKIVEGGVTEKGFFGFAASKRWGAGTAGRRESEETVR
jgi:hypothetical protein